MLASILWRTTTKTASTCVTHSRRSYIPGAVPSSNILRKPTFKASGLRAASKKAKKLKKQSVWGEDKQVADQSKERKRKEQLATEHLPKPYFFLEVTTEGSTVPSYYNKDYYPTHNYVVNKLDVYRAPLWQKATGEKIVSNADDEAAQKMRQKFGLASSSKTLSSASSASASDEE